MKQSLKRFMFIAVGGLLLLAALVGVSLNKRTAQNQAKAIEAADLAGQPTTALEKNLKDFAALHLGVQTSYVLTGSYNRAVEATKAAVAAASAANSQIYTDAQRQCSGKTDSITQARCNQAYLDSHLLPLTSPSLSAPQLASFTRSVKSPAFVADLAGALLVGGLLAVVYGVYVILAQRRRR